VISVALLLPIDITPAPLPAWLKRRITKNQMKTSGKSEIAQPNKVGRKALDGASPENSTPASTSLWIRSGSSTRTTLLTGDLPSTPSSASQHV